MGGQIAAHYAGCPMDYYLNIDSKIYKIKGIQIVDIFSAPRFRSVGFGKTTIFSKTFRHYQNTLLDIEYMLIYGFVAGNSLKYGVKYLGYKTIERIALFKKKIDLGKNEPSESSIDYQIEEVYEVDDEYDELFGRAASNYGFIAVRDAKYINWRYLCHPENRYKIFKISSNGKLIGWGVFKKRGQEILWVDSLFDKNYIGAAGRLINRVEHYYIDGSGFIAGWFSLSPLWWGEALQELGFKKENEPDNLHFTYRKSKLTGSDIIDKSIRRLYYTMGDSDLY